jgi:hypothetical protein
VDECTVRVLDIPLYHIRPKGTRPETIPATSKIRIKLNVFAGISCRGATPFVVFTENMDASIYKEIIERVIFPFGEKVYDSLMYLHQDNDPKHSSKLCMGTMEAYRIKWVG